MENQNETLFAGVETKLTSGLLTALVEWQKVKPTVDLDGKNKHFDSKYATLANIIKAIDKPLTGCGLGYTQVVTNNAITTIIFHAESMGVIVSTRPLNDNMKVQDEGSYITYQKRYQLAAALGIAADDDKDGNNIEGGASLPPCTDKELKALIDGKQKGIASGNGMAIEQMFSMRRMTVAQLRIAFLNEFFMVESSRAMLFEKLENEGYTVVKNG
jgi:hypothetical protein